MIIKGEHLILGQDETYNPDVQEALSLRYGESTFMVLPLTSGRIAVVGYFRELHSICDTWEEACASAREIQASRYVPPREGRLPSGPKGRDSVDIQELEALLGL